MPGRFAWADADIGDRRNSLRNTDIKVVIVHTYYFYMLCCLFLHLKQKNHAKKSSHFVDLFVDEHLLRPVLGVKFG